MTRAAVPDKSRTPKRVTALALVATIASAGWAVYEHRRGDLLTDTLTDATVQKAQLQQQLTNLAQELKANTVKLNELAQKNMPVSVIFRPAPSGNGLVTFFKNNAPSPVEIAVILSNPVTSRRREVNLNIGPNGLQSIGEAEGWVFVPGHHVQVTHAQFGTVDYVVPDK